MPAEQQRKSSDPNNRSSLAEICAIIGKETRTIIESSRSGLTNVYTFVIKGEESDISLARRRIWSRLAETITIALEIPQSCLGLIIGPGGKTIQSLVNETSTKINVPKNYEGTIIIAGDFEGISLAKERIEALIHDKVSRSSATLTVERPYLSYIAGTTTKAKANDYLIGIADQYGLKINVTSTKDSGNLDIFVSGDRNKVEEFTVLIRAELEEAKKMVKAVSTRVPKALHRLIIGSKGETLSFMEESTSCIIVVPSLSDNSEEIVVFGTEATLRGGLQSVLEKIAALDSQSIKVSELKSYLILHRNRKFLKDLESKYNVQIHIVEDEIKVDGKKAEVALTMMELRQILEELDSFLSDSIVIESRFVKHIIGKKGHTLEQLQVKYNVELIIPDNQPGQEKIKITIASMSEEAIHQAKEFLKQRIQDFSDHKTIDLSIENKFHGTLIGTKGANIKQFRDRYSDTVIDFVDDKIQLRGPSKEVVAAAKELESTVERLKHEAFLRSYTSELKLFKDQINAVIDSSGKLNKSLMIRAREYDIKLILNDNIITIQGLKSNVDSFKPLLENIIKDITEKGTEMIKIPQEYHSILIGKGGKNAKHLVQKYNIRLNIPAADKVGDDTITLIGPKSNLKAAKDEIVEFIEHEKTYRNVETIFVPKSSVPFIRGKAGITIGSICNETNTRIDMEKSDKEEISITIAGAKEGIDQARDRINELIEESKSYGSKIVMIDPNVLGLLNGIGAFALRSLATRYETEGIRIIPVSPKNHIIVRGDSENINQAVHDLELLAERVQHFITEEIPIPHSVYREIIGVRGENVARLRNTFQVNVSIPKDIGNDKVTLVGQKDDVEKVKLEILKYVKNSRVFQMPIPYRQDVLDGLSQELAKLEIIAQEHRDGILISGNSGGLTEALKRMENTLEEVKRSKIIENFAVPRKFHGAIIGRGGIQIENLRKETRCQIYVPKPGSLSEEIQLCGSPEAIDLAKTKIRELMFKLEK